MKTQARRSFSLPRAQASPSAHGRRCAHCGGEIDPKDWCPGCIDAGGPCGNPHKRDRKRADAAFCNAECRRMHRVTYERDCL